MLRPKLTRKFAMRATGFFLASLVWAFSAGALSSAERGQDPSWNEFVVGKVSDLKDSAIKNFLTTAHFNNPYAKTISPITKTLGPFAPEADNVFWVPTIDVPMEKDNWRFLSELDTTPKDLLKLATVKKNGKTYVRMFLHPFSVDEPKFKEFADRFGGFKYEFQGSTTASARSLIAWKTSKPRNLSKSGEIDFPKSERDVIWPKVSITRMDIDGTRLNPVKKLVRASTVTQLMSDIPDATKKRVGFDFAGEWAVGVPRGTDAGFVVREVLPDYKTSDGKSVEAGFSVLSPDRLSQMTKNVADPEAFIQEKLVRPMLRTASFLMMEEGMVGEYHNQNFNYVIDKKGVPTGKVLLHDADSFRTSVLLRAMEGKDTADIRKIDAPFFFMKDGVFLQTENSTGDYGLNSLLNSYFVDPKPKDTVAGFIKQWCKGISKYKSWCNDKSLKKMFLETFSEELAPYVGHPIENLSLAPVIGKKQIGLPSLIKERMVKIASKNPLYLRKPDEKLQKILADEYARLVRAGRGKSIAPHVMMDTTNFYLDVENGNAVIHAVAKEPEAGKVLKGIALPTLSNDSLGVKFANRVYEVSGIKIPMDTPDGIEKGLLTRPWMQDLGGGSNFAPSVHEYLSNRRPARPNSITYQNAVSDPKTSIRTLRPKPAHIDDCLDVYLRNAF
jgi:hypothetical protein